MAARVLVVASWLPIVLPVWALRFAWRFRGFRKLIWLVVQVLALCLGVVLFARHPEEMLAAATSKQGMLLMVVLAFLMGRTSHGRRGVVAYEHSAPVVRQQTRPDVQQGVAHDAQVIQLASYQTQRKLRHQVVLAYLAIGERIERRPTAHRDEEVR